MAKIVHIVSFNVPYPPDYGGIIDVFYKVKALHDCGVDVILHCYEYGRTGDKKLNEICKKIYFYKRKKGLKYNFSFIPYIVKTRFSDELLSDLKQDDFPVLFEGLHTTAIIPQLLAKDRKIVVRTHNIEHEYYNELSKAESDLFRKLFFYIESRKLKSYQQVLQKANQIAAISPSDYTYFNNLFGKTTYIPVFHLFKNVIILKGTGEYALFHGNLSVPENIKTALFLVNEIFNALEIPFVIAGKNPNIKIINAASENNLIKIIANPSENEMDTLLSNAQLNILTTFQNTGIKLKLLAALYRGRHCIVNSQMVENTDLESLCIVADSKNEIKAKINELFTKPFNETEVLKRQQILDEKFSTNKSALKLIDILFS